LKRSEKEKAVEILTAQGEKAWVLGHIEDAAENEAQVEIN
jgi:phosphoribosylformylglycinamidine cyclo-ligase